MNGRWMTALAAVCLTAAMSACAGAPAAPASSRSASSISGGPAATTGWLAVLRVDPEPDALDDDTAALTDVLGTALVVSPAACLRGLPVDVVTSTYVLGVMAPDRATLDELLARTDLDPLFRVEVQIVCTD
jgi:hypothetical protein